MHYYDGDKCLRNMHIVMGHTQFLGFLKGNVYKYIYRMGRKGGSPKRCEDAMKARDYLSYLIKYDSRNEDAYLSIANRLRPVSAGCDMSEENRLELLDLMRTVF